MDELENLLDQLTADDEDREVFARTYKRVMADTGDHVKAALAAFGAINRKWHGLAVKSRINPGEPGIRIGGWAITFGDSLHRDMDYIPTYFDANTDFMLEFYANAPLWIEHGEDRKFRSKVIGHRQHYRVFKHGVWLEHFIPASTPNFASIKRAIEDGLYFYSTDSMGHHVENGYNPATGGHRVWPMAGCSLTDHPAEPGNGPVIILEEHSAEGSRKKTAARGAGDVHLKGGADPSGQFDHSGRSGTKPAISFIKGLPGDIPGVSVQPGDNTMLTDEQLQAIAEWLGLPEDADPETILTALDALRAQIAGAEEEEVEEMLAGVNGSGADATMTAKRYKIDRKQLVDALGLPEDATDEAILEEIDVMLEMVEEVADEVEELSGDVAEIADEVDELSEEVEGEGSTKALNYRRLRKFRRMAKKTPVNDPPRFTRESGQRKPGAKKSRYHSGFNHNRGARMPGVTDLVLGLLSGNQRQIKSATKASGVSEQVTGGYLVRREVSDTILAPLREREVVLAAGADMEPMDGIETLTVYKDLDGGEAYWAGEGKTVASSDPNFGRVVLSLKELVASYTVSRRQIRATANFEQRLRDTLTSKLGRKMDKSFLLGTGAVPNDGGSSGAEPRGLLNILPSGQITTIGSGNGAKPTMNQANQAVSRIKGRNVEDSDTWGWIMSSAIYGFWNGLTATTGQSLMRENWAGQEHPTLLNIPRYETNQVPNNIVLGDNDDTSYQFLGDWQYAVVGMGMDVEIAVSEHAKFDNRQVVIQAVAMVDFGVYYTEAFEVLAGVRGQ